MLLQPMLHTPERRLNFERGLVIHEMLKVFFFTKQRRQSCWVMTIVLR